MRPTDVRAALQRIARSAEAISEDLHALLRAAQSQAPSDGEQPAQIAQLLGILAVAINPGSPGADALAILMDFDRRLVGAATASTAAVEVLEPGGAEMAALSRKKGAHDPALAYFAGILAAVWRSLTGCTPSTSRDRLSGEAPDFVLFVLGAAALVNEKLNAEQPPKPPVAAPTIDAIAGALKGTRIPSEK